MDFFTAIRTVFAKYATFSGRAPRAEYWFFILFTLVAGLVASMLDIFSGLIGNMASALDWVLFPTQLFSPLNLLFFLVTIVPSIACTTRRLHDVNRSGWWQLLWSVPVVGWIVMIVWTSSRGTAGDNRFGAQPYDQPATSAAV